MPLLTLVVDPKEATPLFAAVSPVVGALILAQDSQSVSWGAAGRLLAAAALGVPLGVALLATAPASALSTLLGAALCVVGAWGLLRNGGAAEPWLCSPHWVWPFGLVSGILGGAINATGPPVVVYSSGRAWSPAVARAAFQGFFLPISIAITGTNAASGLWTWNMLAQVLCL
eukprot:gene2861-3456_t